MNYYQLIFTCFTFIGINSSNAMLRVVTKTSIPINRYSSKRFLSSSYDDIRRYIAIARLAAQHNDWAGVHGQAKLFAHNHTCLAQLQKNKNIMDAMLKQLNIKVEGMLEDGTIIHQGVEALAFQIKLKEAGAVLINLNDFRIPDFKNKGK